MLHEFLPCEEQRAASRRRRLLRLLRSTHRSARAWPANMPSTFGMPSLMRVLLSIPQPCGHYCTVALRKALGCMSQSDLRGFDQASQRRPPVDGPGSLADVTTDGIAPAERGLIDQSAFWVA